MNYTKIHYAVLEAKRNGQSVSHVELTEKAMDELHKTADVEPEDSKSAVAVADPLDVKEGSTNQLITECGDTYSI